MESCPVHGYRVTAHQEACPEIFPDQQQHGLPVDLDRVLVFPALSQGRQFQGILQGLIAETTGLHQAVSVDTKGDLVDGLYLMVSFQYGEAGHVRSANVGNWHKAEALNLHLKKFSPI